MLFLNSIIRFLKDRDGASAIEYALLAAGIALTIIVVIFAFGDQLVGLYDTMAPAMSSISTSIVTG